MTDQTTPQPPDQPVPFRYVDEDQYCLSARLLPDLNTGGTTGTVSITIEGSDEPQSAHVPVTELPKVLAGIAQSAGLAAEQATRRAFVDGLSLRSAEYRSCGASIDVTTETGFVCSRRIGHDGECAPRPDEDDDQAARAAIAPLEAAIRKAKAQQHAEIRTQAIADTITTLRAVAHPNTERGAGIRWAADHLDRMAKEGLGAEDDTPTGQKYPCGLGIFCDTCGTEFRGDFIVTDTMTKAERLEVIRNHVRTKLGWQSDETGDNCPSCRTDPAAAAIRTAILTKAIEEIESLPQDYECDPGRGDACDELRKLLPNPTQ
ncbi:hypothetical protein ACK8N7_26540 [Streptomyces griseobrunneus]